MPAVTGGIRNSTEIADSAALLKEIEDLKSAPLATGEIWFLVDVHWYKKVVDYLQGNSDYPGPIDNSGILMENGSRNRVLKEGLQDELDYVLLPERAWNMIREKFGVMPGEAPIGRKVIDQGMFVKHKTVEVYPLELNLALHSDQNSPILTIYSRTETPKEIMKTARTKFHLGSGSQIRLFQKHENDVLELVSDYKSNDTLQDLSFTSHQTIVVDVEENGKWHIDAERSSGVTSASSSGGNHLAEGGSRIGTGGEAPSIFSRGGGSVGFGVGGGGGTLTTPGLCGLTNLGNTCFMNSALQCMVNAGPLTDYFISDQYKPEINETNPLGMHGEIAQSFGDLCKQMWSGRCSSVIPRNFKLTVGRFAPQFSGYQQQDSQELMAFLLDGLHEDLNRVRQKPYVEIKDADGLSDEVVAADAWSNYKKRNDSIIVDLFHALLKSTVVCPECGKISVTFDPFCYLSLPLPAKKERSTIVQFVPLNPEKPMLKIKAVTPKGGTMKDLTESVGRLVGVNPTQLIVCDIYGSRVFKLFDSSTLLSVIMDRDVIFVYEVENVPPSEHPKIVVFYTRVEKKGYISPHYNAQLTLTGLPMLVCLPKNHLTQQHLKAAAEKVFKRFTNLPPPGEAWWRPDSDSDSGVEENGDNGPQEQESMDAEVDDGSMPELEAPPLFVMRVVNSGGTTNFEDIKPTNAPISTDQTSGEIYITLDWHAAAGSKFFDGEYMNYVQDHESVSEVKAAKKMLSLDECLDLFTTTEKLGEDDLWYCPQCKKHQQATKKFDLWTLPDILIIHLKRFSYTRFWRDKIEAMIDYPLRNLDLSKWVINPKHQPFVYDLIAVSNHYGGLGGGHYTAYAKNKPTGKWFSFDDSHVTAIGENDAMTKSGYVLVYARRRPTTIEANTDPNVEMEEGE